LTHNVHSRSCHIILVYHKSTVINVTESVTATLLQYTVQWQLTLPTSEVVDAMPYGRRLRQDLHLSPLSDFVCSSLMEKTPAGLNPSCVHLFSFSALVSLLHVSGIGIINQSLRLYQVKNFHKNRDSRRQTDRHKYATQKNEI